MQKMASRGLSAVYQLGDEAGRNELLNSLMGTLQGKDSLHTVLSREGHVFYGQNPEFYDFGPW